MLLLLVTASLFQLVGPDRPRTSTLGTVAFVLKNDTKEDGFLRSVRAKGKVLLELEVSETGEGRTRKLQTLVALYERSDRKSLRAGKLVKEYLAPEVMLADQSGMAIQKQSVSFDAPEGDYVARIFFCDPDMPVRSRPGMKELADQLKLPGNVRAMQSFLVHVEPPPAPPKVATVPPPPPTVKPRP